MRSKAGFYGAFYERILRGRSRQEAVRCLQLACFTPATGAELIYADFIACNIYVFIALYLPS